MKTTRSLDQKARQVPARGGLFSRGLFSRGLYFDALRRLRVAGSLLASVCLISILTQLIPELSVSDRNRFAAQFPQDFASVLVLFSMLAPVALMFQAFSFVFRRSGSDFYHSLPCTRRCLGFTLFAAAMTWALAVLGLALLTCAVLIPLSPFPFPMPLLGWMLAYNLVLMLLMAGCMLVGISLAGRPWDAVLIAGLALYLPRWAMAVFRYLMVNVSGMMIYSDANPFFSMAMHLPAASLALLYRPYELVRLMGKTTPQLLSYAPGILYSLLLAVLALAWGMRCFARRKSELAGHSLARPIQRYLLHAGVALAGLLWGGYLLHKAVRGYRGGWTDWPQGWWVMVALCAFLLLYLAYQRVRARCWHTMIMAAPCMLLAFALAFAVCGGAVLAGLNTCAGLPKASEIASVRFPAQAGDRTVFTGGISGGRDLELLLIDGLRYDKPEMREFVAGALAEHAAFAADANAGNAVGYPTAIGGRQLTMEVTCNDGRKLRRTVRLSDTRSELVRRLMFDSPGFMAALRQTPKASSVEILGFETVRMPEGESAEAFWQTLQTELDALSDMDFIRHTGLRFTLPMAMRDEREFSIGYRNSVSAYEWRGFDLVTRSYGVDPKTPRTAGACVKVLNQQFQSRYQEALAALDVAPKDSAEGTISYNLEFLYTAEKAGRKVERAGRLYRLPTWEERYVGSYVLEEEVPDREAYERERLADERSILNILRSAPLAEADGNGVVLVGLSVPIWNAKISAYDWLSGSAYLALSDSDLAALTGIMTRRISNGYAY